MRISPQAAFVASLHHAAIHLITPANTIVSVSGFYTCKRSLD